MCLLGAIFAFSNSVIDESCFGPLCLRRTRRSDRRVDLTSGSRNDVDTDAMSMRRDDVLYDGENDHDGDDNADSTPSLCLIAGGTSLRVTTYDGGTPRVCNRLSLDENGCCEQDTAPACEDCNITRECCSDSVACVACCLQPSRNDRRLALQHAMVSDVAINPVYRLLHAQGGLGAAVNAEAVDAFRFCQLRCRTSGASTWRENAYRSAQRHCYGHLRPALDLNRG